MIPVLGALGGCGLLLIVSPLLWPRRAERKRARSGERVAERLARAGLPAVAPGLFVTVSVLLSLAAAAVAYAATSLAPVALLALVVAGLAPWSAAGWRARARRRAVRGLWPEVVDHLLGAIRAGRPLPDAIAGLGVHGPGPLRDGFQVFERRWRETGTVGVALDAAKAHFADPTADRLLEVLRMARQVGGTELPAILRDLAVSLRQDVALRAEAEARQSWVTSAGKLGLAAPWLVLLLLATRPEAAAAYGTPAGTVLILAAAGVTGVAYRVMLALGRLPEDRRWFT
ncbi:type II secretion system F family protein [Amnibacterium sp. CER49]|uniref:type II secretion system F family protein n=1 Tax=Amnibacterium sp. CER49 TaxID=3039161 RepID=UPI0024493C79|nr:type II secretion system F family protein [Amnibacterium sp. CER49]MDH2445287.1 type II secretion system F family protein [Amnibacterium sp. CER49]